MRNKAILFAVIALVMLAVPGWMIVKHERILRDGTVYKFRTAPVDPYDPFRGEYVRLDFAAESGNWTHEGSSGEAEERSHFATLAVDNDGFAVIDALLSDRPVDRDFLMVTTWDTYSPAITRVSLPFDRYYLEEGDGRRAEDLVAGRTSDLVPWPDGPPQQDTLPTYAVVRILNGEAVIEDLIVGDRSIHAWLKEPPANEHD